MKAAFLGAFLLVATPLAAQDQSDYEAAVAARLAGDHETAVRLLDAWIARYPDDSDALVQRGYAHLGTGAVSEAARDFRAALAVAPDYSDARAGLELAAERRDAARDGFLIAGSALSDVAAGGQDWWEASLSGEVPISQVITAGARATWYRRFGLEDTEIEGRLAARPSDDVWLRASIGGTPSADFRPEIALSMGADLRVASAPHATVLSFDAAWQRFPLQEVVILTPGITQYFGGGRWWGTLRGIGIVPAGSALEMGALARLDYAPNDRLRFFVGGANGPDTNLGIVNRVSSAFAGAELPLNTRLSLMPSVAQEWREGGTNRTELRVDLKATF